MLFSRLGTVCFTLLLAACSGQRLVINSAGPADGVSVSGMGEVRAAPDIARMNVGVEVRASAPEQGTQRANERMQRVLEALKQAGVAAADLRTHSFSVQFEERHPPQPVPLDRPEEAEESAPLAQEQIAPKRGQAAVTSARAAVEPTKPAPEIAPQGFYRITNMVEVTVRDLDRAGALLRMATEAGANTVWGLSLDIEDRQALVAEARKLAVEQARRNAEALAQLSGVALGRVLAVSEDEGGMGGPVYRALRLEAKSMGDVPVERGEITVSQRVQMLFAIAR